MRIRKHASKLPQWSPPNNLLSGPAPAEPDPVCHLNRSPWDVSPSSLHDYLRHQVEDEDDEGLGFDGMKISDEVDEGNGEKRKKDIRKKRIIDSGGSVCKKSDGKGWHCKREAKLPFSLCDYHLKQVRAYYHGANVVQVQPDLDSNSNSKTHKEVIKRKKKVKKRATPNGLEFYYYYSGFGPWRAKRRAVESAPTVNKSDNDNDDDDAEVRPIGEVDDSSEDSEVDEAKRKKGRKPIKARSLKSLL